MLTKTESTRIDLLRFPLAVAIVLIHAFDSNVYVAGGAIGVHLGHSLADAVRVLFAEGFARLAVPIYMITAGYFMFTGPSRGFRMYSAKVKTRFSTLLVPYLFWNTAVLAAFALSQAEPQLRRLFSGANPMIAQFGWREYLDAFVGYRTYPIDGPLWFLRDLMLMVLISPLLRPLSKLKPFLFFPLMALAWVLFGQSPLRLPSPVAIIFFPTGAYLAMRGISLFRLEPYGKLLVFVYLVLALLDCRFYGLAPGRYIHNFAILLGIPAAIYGTHWFIEAPRFVKQARFLAESSFFIYLCHMPILGFARKLVYLVLKPQNPWLVLALFFMLPITIIAFLVPLYRGLTKLLPQIMSFATGHRVRSARTSLD
jgi:peptidoglycan/LPS O-acetylase OafA/YrhL